MMKYLYSSPLRVYLCLGALALAGIYSGTQLPVSLFPNSTKPMIHVEIPYGSFTANEFMHQHGNRIETQLRGISTNTAEVEKTRSYYNQESIRFEVEFKWGGSTAHGFTRGGNGCPVLLKPIIRRSPQSDLDCS